jgi:hypothetical protein
LISSKGDIKAAAKGALLGAVSAGLASGAGDIYRANAVAGMAAHGVAGCINGELSGGNCGTGALASMITKGSTVVSNSLPVTIVTGALTSRITGQDPTTGGVLAAFQYLYNQEAGMASEMVPDMTTGDRCEGTCKQMLATGVLGTIDFFAYKASPIAFGVNFTAGASMAGYNAWDANRDLVEIGHRAVIGGMVAGPQTWAMPVKNALGVGAMFIGRAGAGFAANVVGQIAVNAEAAINWVSAGASAATAVVFGVIMPGNSVMPKETVITRAISSKATALNIHAAPGTAAGAAAQVAARHANAPAQKKE